MKEIDIDTASPAPFSPQNERGAFNAVNASIQQLSGGVASVIGGHLVSLGADGTSRTFRWVRTLQGKP